MGIRKRCTNILKNKGYLGLKTHENSPVEKVGISKTEKLMIFKKFIASVAKLAVFLNKLRGVKLLQLHEHLFNRTQVFSGNKTITKFLDV